MRELAAWIEGTSFSGTLRSLEWSVPLLQSIHLLAIGVTLASVFLINLRIQRRAAHDQTLMTVTQRYAPWLWGALVILAGTGLLLIWTEPERELASFSFWVKMALLAVGIVMVAAFQVSLSRNERDWEEHRMYRGSTRAMAALTFIVWCGVLLMGRLIAFDTQFWGALSSSGAS